MRRNKTYFHFFTNLEPGVFLSASDIGEQLESEELSADRVRNYASSLKNRFRELFENHRPQNVGGRLLYPSEVWKRAYLRAQRMEEVNDSVIENS